MKLKTHMRLKNVYSSISIFFVLTSLVGGVRAENYHWVFSGSHGWPSSSPFTTCQSFFDWYKDYYDHGNINKLLNFRVEWVEGYEGRLANCKYDLDTARGLFPDQLGQVYLKGSDCPYGQIFDPVQGCMSSVQACAGNPVEIISGAKVQSFTDVRAKGLYVSRVYNSTLAEPWVFSFTQAVFPVVVKGFGSEYLMYKRGGVNYALKNEDGCWKSPNSSNCIRVEKNSDGITTTKGREQKGFDEKGRLLWEGELGSSIKTRYSYGANSITLSRGTAEYTITLNNAMPEKIVGMGQVITYGYAGEKLSSVDHGSGKVEFFHYNDAGYLTEYGVNDVVYASWEYDTAGRAVSSVHAGGVDKTLFEYHPNKTTVTNSLNKDTIFHYESAGGVYRITQVEGVESDYCQAASKYTTYDDSGNVSSRTDFKGAIVTYSRDVFGRETSRTMSYGDSAAVTATIQYHQKYDVPEKIQRGGVITSYSYSEDGRLLSVEKYPAGGADEEAND